MFHHLGKENGIQTHEAVSIVLKRYLVGIPVKIVN